MSSATKTGRQEFSGMMKRGRALFEGGLVMEIRLGALSDVDARCVLYELFFEYNSSQQPEYYRAVHYPKASPRYGEYPRNVITSATDDFFVAADNGRIVGFLHVSEDSTPPFASVVPHRYAEVVDLFVTEPHRRLGIGSALVDAAKAWAKARGLDYLNLLVLNENADASGFYQRYGFKTVSQTMRCAIERETNLERG
jgi:ribosomal protein S18 acetylase RimI-like enzyme